MSKPPSGARRALVECLEPREMLSVSQQGGFTVVTPPPGARLVFVSTSQGRDTNSGLSATSPVRSIGRAKNLLRSGAGDQLLLKRGDTFRESFGYWGTSGRDGNNPAVIGAYGTGPRPRVETGVGHGLTSNQSIHDVAILGIHLVASGRGGAMPDGININGRTSGLRIEDCKIEGYRNNILLQNFFGPINNVTIRRSVIADSWSNRSHSQGLYAEGVHGLVLEENVFDHNGWNGNTATVFSHGAYVTGTSSGLVAKNNVFSNNASHGLQARPGAYVSGNLFLNNAVGLSFGLVNGSGPVRAGGVSGVVDNNVFMGGHNYSGQAGGVGVQIANVRSASLTNNLFANGPHSDNPAISLEVGRTSVNPGAQVGINNLTIADNVVYNWSRGMNISGALDPGRRGPTGLNNLVVSRNDFQQIRSFQAIQNNAGSGSQRWSNNRYHVPGNRKTPIIVGGRALTVAGFRSIDAGAQEVQVRYPDPGRTVGRYAGDFLARARNLSRQGWDPRYTAGSVVAFLRGGFRGGGGGPVPTISPPAPAPSPSGRGPAVSVGDTRVTEGNRFWATATFGFGLSARSSQPVTVRWETRGESAAVGQDYVGRNGVFTFKPGETFKTVTVQVKPDYARERDETFVVNVLSVGGGSVADGQGRATIVNND